MHAFSALLALVSFGAPAQPEAPRNVIVFIADGCGSNTHRAYELWRGEPALYRSGEWAELSVATYALRPGGRASRGSEPLAQDGRLVYDPTLAWNDSPTDGGAGGYPFFFEGYRWLRATAPDSANTATAILSGVSTYVGSINMDGALEPITTAAEIASGRGKSVGVVSSVLFTHATPACAAGAHVPQREMYGEIASQILSSGVCDVIAGAGHPEYDDSARRRDEPSYSYIGERDWSALRAGEATNADGEVWTLVDDADRVAALASGDSPTPLFIMARAAKTLQQKRAPFTLRDGTAPGGHERNAGVPTLTDLSLAALNAVDDDPDGFFLMIEGGAVDWAMHDNQIGRMIEEMAEFHDAIETVCAVLDTGERGCDWSDTLVIVTADHDHMLFGPESDTVPFQPLADYGAGSVPGHRWHADSHSNQPVPLFVRGPGSERFAGIATAPDEASPDAAAHMRRRPYFHQIEIGRALKELLGANP